MCASIGFQKLVVTYWPSSWGLGHYVATSVKELYFVTMMLKSDASLKQTTKLTVDDIKQLIELCLSKCYFLWNYKIYSLESSAPIGLHSNPYYQRKRFTRRPLQWIRYWAIFHNLPWYVCNNPDYNHLYGSIYPHKSTLSKNAVVAIITIQPKKTFYKKDFYSLLYCYLFDIFFFHHNSLPKHYFE